MILHCLLFLLLLFPWVTRIELYSGLVPLCVLSFSLQGIPVHSVGAADIQIYYVNIIYPVWPLQSFDKTLQSIGVESFCDLLNLFCRQPLSPPQWS